MKEMTFISPPHDRHMEGPHMEGDTTELFPNSFAWSQNRRQRLFWDELLLTR